ncbi:MAG: DUF3795 domain-containing protein [Methanomassiliicoccales archaeon]|jgi:hypothetical protein|nr:DUF3795 domain-containing protein [Methanomassiliicoccales archaeon]
MVSDSDLDHVAYCGLYCGLCAQRAEVPVRSKALIEILHDEGFDDFYQYDPEMRESFPPFWNFLQKLASFDCSCRRDFGGPPDCPIRKCAREKRIIACPLCESFPCQHIEKLAKRYPLLIADGKRMKEIGLENWIEEQKVRALRGFRYSLVRYPH